MVRRLPVTVTPLSGVTTITVSQDPVAVFSCSMPGSDVTTFTVNDLIPSQNYLLTIDLGSTVTLPASAGGTLWTVLSAHYDRPLEERQGKISEMAGRLLMEKRPQGSDSA